MHANPQKPPTDQLASPAPARGPTDPVEVANDIRLRRGELHTQISRPCALLVTVSFLLLIYCIPLSQALLELREDETLSVASLFERAPSAENLRAFEKELEQASYIKDFVQPRVQLLLSRFGRVGNRRTVIGHKGWLYYTPGLTHLVGPSFIDEEALSLRSAESENGEQPDPRPAIFAFARMLSDRGISLVLFPVPDKTMLQPRELHGRGRGAVAQPVANNLGFARFTEELRSHGITVFDPTPPQLSAAEAPHFLVQDTHWTPSWMNTVARDLATVVGKLSRKQAAPVEASTRATKFHRLARQQVARVGDLVDMLKLPDEQTLFRPQTISIEQVQDAAGQPWQPDPESDVLLLGDSFTNVFSEAGMGWGEGAGLAPHLSLALRRDVDVIAQNDSGAFATRQALARALDAGEERLAGKRVVIWEFASRELSVGDWKNVEWPQVLHAKASTDTH